MLLQIAKFELRYQVKSPIFIVAAAFFLLAFFLDMAVLKLATVGGGNVLFNSPHSIIVSHLLVSLLFLFVGAAFVSNVVLRDDQTGFGAILRSTQITKLDYLLGRFLGAFAASALLMATATLGAWLGTLMPFANQEMLGPNRISGFVYGYGLFALPNVLIISAILFALATAVRSTAGTFIGVIALLILYLVGQNLMEGETQLLNSRVLADPLGMSAYMAASKYFTAGELNAGLVPVSDLMVQSRLIWVGVSIVLLGVTYRLFRLSDRGMSRRRQRKLRRQVQMEAHHAAPGSGMEISRLASPSFDGRSARAQFRARAWIEMRHILRSPVFLILLGLAFFFTLTTGLTAADVFDVPFYPLTFLSLPENGFDTILVIIATYYGGELVWREREHKTHEIIDATPIPAAALMLPKMLGLTLVLFATLLIGVLISMLVQLLKGGVDLEPERILLWYFLPSAVDAALLAALAVFVQALSPSKYVGWGMMVIYIILRIFGPTMGLEYPLSLYRGVPEAPLSDMAGAGIHWKGAWWFRLFWSAIAALLLIAAHLLWPRGTEERLSRRLRRLPARLKGQTSIVTAAAIALSALSGGWTVYNTLILNDFRTSKESEAYFANLEKRYFRYASLPQPSVKHVDLEVDLFPEQIRAEVRGRYRLVNETNAPIGQVHVRLLDLDLDLVGVEFPDARLELNDEEIGYRIYRLDVPMQPGETRSLAFRTRRQQLGFRASGAETGLAPNGTDLNSLELTPGIGMSDMGLIEDPATRRKYGLSPRQPLPRLDDAAATKTTPGGDRGWTTAKISVSTAADQTAIAPGKRVTERVRNGRRTAVFVSDTPINNMFSIQSANYSVKRQAIGGIEHAVYYHPAHPWNVGRILAAMQASIDYYSKAFGPYQFDQIRIVETPAYRRGGGQAFPNTVAVGEMVFAWDVSDPNQLDMVTLMTAHELAHQWWGHQVRGARMQGAALLGESISQYSALMVLKKVRGDSNLRRFLHAQIDRYLTGRRTQIAEEQPLVSAGLDQDYVNYGKGPLAFYLLQQRMGEEAVNRALRRFVKKYKFGGAPYPRSVDLIALLRAEAQNPEQQALITDLFERITLYDLKVENPTAVRRRDGRWEVTVPVEAMKLYANGKGTETEARLTENIEIGLFTAEPGWAGFDTSNVISLQRHTIRSGKQVLKFVTDRKPSHAGIDPYNFYIDRNPWDNVSPVN
ncbi:ABC transporter permease/M1 family aminopeptidase [Tsuneonella sp. HG222]